MMQFEDRPSLVQRVQQRSDETKRASCAIRYAWGAIGVVCFGLGAIGAILPPSAHYTPFILLDEPTSNLDSLNEAAVLRALAENRAGKTIVLVSHRPSAAAIADVAYSVERAGRAS